MLATSPLGTIPLVTYETPITYIGSQTIDMNFSITSKNYISASENVLLEGLAISINGQQRALSANVYLNMSLNFAAQYAGHDFAINQNYKDIVAGSSPVNIGNIIQSNG